jgi:hypothetical protein
MKAIIPLFDNANFSESVTLDDVNYGFSFQYNTRGDFWSMSIFDGNGNLILANIKLVVWFPLTLRYNNPALPTGTFILCDPSASTQNIEPGRHDFTSGRKLELLYVSKV